jgi:hypothetical protein
MITRDFAALENEQPGWDEFTESRPIITNKKFIGE